MPPPDELPWHPYDPFLDDAVQELADGLSGEDLRSLHATLRRQGRRAYLAWLSGNAEECARHLREPPRGRAAARREARRTDPPDVREIYGAILFAQLAARMHHHFHDPALTADRADPRDQVAARGALLWQGYFEMQSLNWWPFDEPSELDDPFLDGE